MARIKRVFDFIASALIDIGHALLKIDSVGLDAM